MGLYAYLLAALFGSFSLLSFLYLHMALIWVAGQVAMNQMREEARREKAGVLKEARKKQKERAREAAAVLGV